MVWEVSKGAVSYFISGRGHDVYPTCSSKLNACFNNENIF